MNVNNSNPPEKENEHAELYAFGMLPADEHARFEQRVLNGEVDAAELDEHLQAMTALCEEMASVMPAPRKAVKESIMAAIRPAERDADGETLQIFLYANEGEWQELAPGISIRLLHQDPEHGRSMVLARLAPGASYPSHRHKGLEECLVLEGDLHVDGRVLRTGDFTASYSEKVHIDTHSEEGCLLLLATPLNDEMLEDCP